MSALVATMSNHGPPHDPNPFGYQFNYSEPYSEPSDIPVNGAPLLNNHEADFLLSFFGEQSYNFSFDFPQPHTSNQPQQEDLNWILDEPAPTLLQATAATPKAASPPANNYHALPASSTFNYGHGFPGPSNMAAGNGHENIHPANTIDLQTIQQPQQPLHLSPQVPPQITPSIENAHTLSAQPSQSLPPSASTMSFDTVSHPAIASPQELVFPDSFPYEMPHAAPHQQHAQQQTHKQADDLTDARLYRFGSDSHFTTEGFRSQHDGENGHRLEKRLLRDLYILEPVADSTANTRATTPSAAGDSLKRSRDDLDDELDSTKRRKGHDSDSDVRAHARRPSAPHSRSGTAGTPTSAKSRRPSSFEMGSAKRRRSSATGGKPPRENLSEEQKRSNHIKSEQKRRNAIKEGFDTLGIMVPEIRVGGLSKSSVLQETAAFLVRVIEANNELDQLLGMTA